MANSRYEYVKGYERLDRLLPDVYIIVRLDGRGFGRFTKDHGFEKPNDRRGLELMNEAAGMCMRECVDIRLAYGNSDEYSFLLARQSEWYQRRESKVLSGIVSVFTSAYVMGWKRHMGEDVQLKGVPSFDGRIVLYPTQQAIMDYFAWRQVDCHVNNLYNTTFWALVQKQAISKREANERLKGTLAKDKHEILYGLSMNYNNEPEMYKKGTTIVAGGKVLAVDIIQPSFWEEHNLL